MVNYKTKGKCKKYIRNLIINLIKKPIRLFTLPNLNFDVERHTIKNGGKVVCCEINKQIYLKQLDIIKKLPIVLYNNKMSSILPNYTFDIAWLDSCGSISVELYDSIQKLNLSYNGTLIITFGFAREHKNYDISSNRIEYYTKLLSSFGYYPYEIYKYRDYKFPMAAFFCTKKLSNINLYNLN